MDRRLGGLLFSGTHIALSLAVALIAAPWAPSQGTAATGLSPLRGDEAYPIAVSNNGIVVGLIGGYVQPQVAGRWVDGEFLPLATPSECAPDLAADISADGAVIVGQYACRAFRWTEDEGIVFVAEAPSAASGVSADGSVLAGAWGPSVGVSDPPPFAFTWTAVQGLGRLPGLSELGSSWAGGISGDAGVVTGHGSFRQFEGGRPPNESELARAIRWVSGEPHEIGSPVSVTTGVSLAGDVVVGVVSHSRPTEGYRWTPEAGFVGLGFLEGDRSSAAIDVSGDGLVIVGRSSGEHGETYNKAILWNARRGMRSVRDELASRGVETAGWDLEAATAISLDGRILVGTGLGPPELGSPTAWIVALPEPATFALEMASLACAFCIASSLRRNRRASAARPGAARSSRKLHRLIG